MQRSRGSQDTEAGVSRAARHRRRDCQVGVLLALVALDLPGGGAPLGKLKVEEYPGTCPALAVHELDIPLQQVVQTLQPARVALRHDQSLIAVHEVDEHDLAPW